MIQFKESMVAAKKVLDLVMAEQSCQNIDGIAEAYQNGRERGYSIVQTARAGGYKTQQIFFSKARGSDQIAVYIGTPSNQGLSEDAWRNGAYFHPDDAEGAAKHIVESMLAFHEAKEAAI